LYSAEERERAEIFAQRAVLIGLLRGLKETHPEMVQQLKRNLLHGHVKPADSDLHEPMKDGLLRNMIEALLAETN
jgi:hypothetical protein